MLRSKVGSHYFWAQFLPLALLVLSAAAIRYDSGIDAELHRLQQQQQGHLELGVAALVNEMDTPLRHLHILDHEAPVLAALNDPSVTNKAAMADSFSSLILRNPNYEQVRWIDQQGMERVGVRMGSDGPQRFPEQVLQSRKKSAYFDAAMALPIGEILVAPMELYAINGHVETPPKPILRLMVPVADRLGNPRGILVINLLMASLLDHFSMEVERDSNRAMLLNNHGYWLYSTNSSQEWGFMFGHELTMKAQYPAIWTRMQNQPQGELIGDGIWSWQNVVLASRDNKFHLHQQSSWTVALYLPPQRILIDRSQILLHLGLFVGVILLLLALLCGQLAHTRRKREVAIHERLRAQAELAASEQKVAELERYQETRSILASIVASSDDAIIGTSLDDIINSWNPGAEKVFGYEAAEVMDQSAYILVPPERTEEARGIVAQIAEGNTVVNFETVRWHKDGRLLDISVTVSPILDRDKKIVGTSYIARDITEHKQLEKEINLHRQHLEALVEQQTAKLRDGNRELALALSRSESATRAKSSFLSNMSHEIRTPMNAVLGLTYLLEKTALQSDQQDLVRKIIAAGQSLLGIINDILDVSKIEAGRMEIERAPFRLSAVLENVVNLTAPSIGNKDVELIVGFNHPGIEYLHGDAMRLEQILINLTSNAIKFTSSGEIRIQVEVHSTSGEQVALRFAVSDSGIGIAEVRQQEIFQAFTQEDASTTRRYGGTGLGLTICHHLVQLMHGEIGVISEPGRGSQFWFVLPFQLLPQSVPELSHNLALHVLVADNNASARSVLLDTVTTMGWQADVVDSGEAALTQTMLRLHQNLPYDVFLLNWHMSGMDGLMTAQAIREASPQHHQPPIVIALTHLSHAQLHQAPGAELIDAVISKPVTPSTLYNTIMQVRQMRGQGPVLGAAAPSAASISGMRVLVVDDSEINREVAMRILEAEGVVVFAVADGSEAVAWLGEHAADLVLMDIQMPIMDGYKATYEIRHTLQLHQLPIVALTAGAFKAQQEAAMEAGMNGFLSKPYNIEQIVSVVRQHSGRLSLALPAASPVPVAAPVADSAAAPIRIIDIAVGLEAWGSVALYRKFLQQFVEQYANSAETISLHIQSGDFKQGTTVAHKLRGSAGTLALNQVYGLAGELEVLLTKAPANFDFQPKMAELAAALQMVLRAIAEYANAPGHAGPE